MPESGQYHGTWNLLTGGIDFHDRQMAVEGWQGSVQSHLDFERERTPNARRKNGALVVPPAIKQIDLERINLMMTLYSHRHCEERSDVAIHAAGRIAT
jgi:hypothetical protein